MKTCPHCKIEIGGNIKKCPFCQNALTGEASENMWPRPDSLQMQSTLYKLQLFFVFVAMIIALSLDFLFNLNHGLHWSLLISMWLLAFEYGLLNLFRKNYSVARIVTLFTLTVLVLMMITSYFTGYWITVVGLVVPVVLIGMLIANFIFTLTGEIGSAMVYLLTNILIGILPYIVLFLFGKYIPIPWIICLVVSVIVFVGACIFRGRSVIGELERRLHM